MESVEELRGKVQATKVVITLGKKGAIGMDQFGQHILDVKKPIHIGRPRNGDRQITHEFRLRQILGGELVRGMGVGVGLLLGIVIGLDIAINESALPGHQHVVEQDHAVAVVEPVG